VIAPIGSHVATADVSGRVIALSGSARTLATAAGFVIVLVSQCRLIHAQQRIKEAA
jgi:hypothetical protein